MERKFQVCDGLAERCRQFYAIQMYIIQFRRIKSELISAMFFSLVHGQISLLDHFL